MELVVLRVGEMRKQATRSLTRSHVCRGYLESARTRGLVILMTKTNKIKNILSLAR